MRSLPARSSICSLHIVQEAATKNGIAAQTRKHTPPTRLTRAGGAVSPPQSDKGTQREASKEFDCCIFPTIRAVLCVQCNEVSEGVPCACLFERPTTVFETLSIFFGVKERSERSDRPVKDSLRRDSNPQSPAS